MGAGFRVSYGLLTPGVLILLTFLACAQLPIAPSYHNPIPPAVDFKLLDGPAFILRGETEDRDEDAKRCGVDLGCYCVNNLQYGALQGYIVDLEEDLRSCRKTLR